MSDPFERIMRRITVTESGCWEYPCRRRDGYGVLGEGPRGGKTLRAHRVTYERMVGPIPDGMQIDHLCRNRGCCNPQHLEVVTPAENTRRGYAFRETKTHCIHGHEFTPDNTVTNQRGARVCVTCQREAVRQSERRAYEVIKRAARLLGITHRQYRAEYGRSRFTAINIIKEMENAQ